jgi:hypothetical protein
MDAPSAAPQREPGCVPKAVISILSGSLGRDDSGAQQTHLVVRVLRGSAFISETRVLGEVYEFLRKRNTLIVHFSGAPKGSGMVSGHSEGPPDLIWYSLWVGFPAT